MENLKSYIATLLVLLTAFLTTARFAIILLSILFISNILVGIITDVLVLGGRFNFKKFLRATMEFLVYICIIAGVVIVAYLQNEKSLGTYAMTALSWLFVYAYCTNIFKNLIRSFPTSVVINFIYYVISFEVIKKIPYFKEFIEAKAKAEAEAKEKAEAKTEAMEKAEAEAKIYH
jgi:hypothetical protein